MTQFASSVIAAPPLSDQWYELTLPESSDRIQRPAVRSISPDADLPSDIAYLAGHNGTATSSAEPAKLALSGLGQQRHVSVFSPDSSEPLGAASLRSVNACVVILRELRRVLPAGSTLRLCITSAA